ncbi:hypothetical protein [Pseudomonas chlororaphis]|uniref:hypothetical protein n=1 Tax=Pseudomonas chlororaphis TaxID=587753 RepID=UPI0004B22A24|nr:hypothetical protein [Pseudomonas chlororaphis]
MSQKNVPLHELLMQLATTVCDLCQRQVDNSRLLSSVNLDVVVSMLLREHDLEADFDQQLRSCIDAMTQRDSVGQTLVFERHHTELRMRQIDTSGLLAGSIDRYELVLFDGCNGDGERWKHLFFPVPRLHYFIHENP